MIERKGVRTCGGGERRAEGGSSRHTSGKKREKRLDCVFCLSLSLSLSLSQHDDGQREAINLTRTPHERRPWRVPRTSRNRKDRTRKEGEVFLLSLSSLSWLVSSGDTVFVPFLAKQFQNPFLSPHSEKKREARAHLLLFFAQQECVLPAARCLLAPHRLPASRGEAGAKESLPGRRCEVLHRRRRRQPSAASAASTCSVAVLLWRRQQRRPPALPPPPPRAPARARPRRTTTKALPPPPLPLPLRLRRGRTRAPPSTSRSEAKPKRLGRRGPRRSGTSSRWSAPPGSAGPAGPRR